MASITDENTCLRDLLYSGSQHPQRSPEGTQSSHRPLYGCPVLSWGPSARHRAMCVCVCVSIMTKGYKATKPTSAHPPTLALI